VYLTENAPLLVSDETDTSGMVISTGLNVARLAPAGLAVVAALAPVNLTVPKLVSGKMPPRAVQQGASAMTSAEDLAAVTRVCV
jgi:hypothetical protein